MIRARRSIAVASSTLHGSVTATTSTSSTTSSLAQRLVRRLHTTPSHTTTTANALLVRIGRRHRPASPSHLVRFRSAMTVDQQDRLQRHMDELTACRDNGNWRAALKRLDSMDKDGFALDAGMYELAMTACARMGKIEVLPGLLQNMEVDALLPTSRTVDAVMQAYIAAEEWPLIVELAKDVTSKGVPLSDAAFQAAFEACGKMRDAVSARTILLNVENANSVQLDTSHYAAAIRACGMSGRADLAASVFAHMESVRGIEADAETFDQLIRSQIVNNAIPHALQSFAAANDRESVVLPESIYTATINALVGRGDFWQASQLFQQMLAHDLSPSAFCYGRMMVAYVRLNKRELATECWERIVAMDEPSPNVKKYAKMLVSLTSTNDSELVASVFEFMFDRFDANVISDVAYAAAIRAYGRLGKTQTALDLFDVFVANRKRSGRPLPRSAGVYVAVFNALSRDTDRDPQENSRDAKRVWDIMVESVPVVLAPAYASLAGVLASSGDLSTLEELMEHAEKSLNKQDFTATTRRLPYHRRFEDAEEESDDAEGFLEDSDEGEEGFSANWHDELLYNGVISGFSKARSDQSERVMEYVRTMHARGMQIKDSVVRASTDTFIKHAKWPYMMQLLDLVDTRVLNNADLTFGDTISKLLEANAWVPARNWISRAHHLAVQPPIRGKMEVLATLREIGSSEWQIAYALARETLSFKQMVQENIDSVADAIDVCVNAGRSDLAIKLYERTVSHPSLVHYQHHSDASIPLRMYKSTLLACMREHTITPDFHDDDEVVSSGQLPLLQEDDEEASGRHVPASVLLKPLEKAENICTQMLQAFARKGALDGDALSLAISIKATMGDDDDVLALYEKMQQHGLQPNSYACNAAIMAYSRSRQLDKVLAIRDALLKTESGVKILEEPKITKSLLFSLAILHNDKLIEKHLAATRKMMPHITLDAVMQAFLKAGRVDKCVELYDDSVSDTLYNAVLNRILDGSAKPAKPPPAGQASPAADVSLSAPLLLKHIAYHGLGHIKPSGTVLRVTKRLIQNGNLREALAILNLYSDPNSDVALSDMKPSFQKEVLEMLLFIHGEQKHLAGLCDVFEKAKTSAVPMYLNHYQMAMEKCCFNADSIAHLTSAETGKKLTKKQREELVAEGATTCLQLFESMRHQFVKPNGAVYLLALQSCQKLGRLHHDLGDRVVRDAVEQGFQYLLGAEFYRLANLAVHERQEELAAMAAAAAALDGFGKPKRGRGAPPKSERKHRVVDVEQLATLALFCHHRGVAVSWKLAKRLLELKSMLPKNVRNELEHIALEAEEVYARASEARNQEQTETRKTWTTTSTATSTAKSPRSSKSAPGSRWGELYLQKMPSDE